VQRLRAAGGLQPASASIDDLAEPLVIESQRGSPSDVLARLRRRRPLVSSALARTEVGVALLPFGDKAVRRGFDVLARLELLRVSDRVLDAAARFQPAGLRSLDAIHLASAQQLGSDLASVVTYGDQMSLAAQASGWTVLAPT